MNQRYENFRFEELPLMTGERYVGHIVRWEVSEDVISGDRLNIWIELYIAEGTFFLYSCGISNKVNSWFYHFCRNLYLLKEDGTVNFEMLNNGCDIICKLKEMPNGDLRVSNIEWLKEKYED